MFSIPTQCIVYKKFYKKYKLYPAYLISSVDER